MPLLAQPDEARTGFNSIRADALKGHIYFLSSEELGGRLAELSGARGRQLRGEPLHERERRCCTALAESEIRLWWWPRYVRA